MASAAPARNGGGGEKNPVAEGGGKTGPFISWGGKQMGATGQETGEEPERRGAKGAVKMPRTTVPRQKGCAKRRWGASAQRAGAAGKCRIVAICFGKATGEQERRGH